MIAEVLAPLRKAQRTAQPAAKIHEPVVQRLPHSTLLIRCRDLLRAPHRCLASAGFRGSPESYRKAKPSLEIAAALLWRKSSHLQRHRPLAVRKVPRRRNSQNRQNQQLLNQSMAGSMMPWPQAAREEGRETHRLAPVPNTRPMMAVCLVDDPGCCRSRHDSLRACFAARCDDVFRNRLFRPKLPGRESQHSQMPIH